MQTTLRSVSGAPWRAWLILLLTQLALTGALAQLTPLPPPTLMIEKKDGHVSPLGVIRADIDTRIVGFVAETRVTMVFRNDLSRPLGGDLYFPLPPGATVSGYALDVNGVMVDGVAVEKDKGRQVFEQEMRKGVDPGLVEWTRGNYFKTRVFPVPAHGTRTVRVSYVSDIVSDATGSRYTLPLNFPDKLAQFHLRLEVVKPAAKPVVQNHTTFPLQLNQWRDSYTVEASRTDSAATGEVSIDLPQVEQQPVVIEKASDGEYYFCVNAFPTDPRPTEKELTLPAIGQVTVFWDASGSRGATDHQRELDWLKAWFGKYREHTVTVNLVPFRNALGTPQPFTIKDGDASALVAAIREIPYDGGTQLGCLTNFPAPASGGVYFLFTDGLGNFGVPEPPELNAPLYLFSSDLTVDEPCLQKLAQRAGGAFFPLRRMTDEQVFAAMAAKPFLFLGAESADGIKDLAAPVPHLAQGRFTVAGKLTAETAQLVLNFGAAGNQLTNLTVTLNQPQAVTGDVLRRFWAQKKLALLLPQQKQNEAAITDLGRQYGLVTPFTSLIVLETLDQYVQHHITPPVSLPDLRAKYGEIVENQAKQDKLEARRKLDHVLDLWKERVEWWNRKYSYSEDFRFRDESATSLTNTMSGLPTQPGAARYENLMPATAAPAPLTMPGGGATPPAAAVSGGFESTWSANSMNEDRQSLSPAKHSIAAPEPEPGVVIKEWDPTTPYLTALKQAGPTNAFAVYLVQRKKYGNSPAFFLDCAEFFRKQKQDDTALQVLSNIAELETENAALLRVLAYRLLQTGQLELACRLFEDVLKLRPEEPQSYRDLALALARRSEITHSRADATRALDLLAKVVNNEWDRFDEIEVVALMELNALWTESTHRFPEEPIPFPADSRLQKLLDLDVRIVLTWDADMTDIDLHVVEPSGERAYYGHNRTTIGGLVSHDFTQGYGPEEYCLRRAMHGTYRVEANYYGSRAVLLTGPVTVQAEVITNFGRPNEKRKSLTLRLEEQKDTVKIGEIEF